MKILIPIVLTIAAIAVQFIPDGLSQTKAGSVIFATPNWETRTHWQVSDFREQEEKDNRDYEKSLEQAREFNRTNTGKHIFIINNSRWHHWNTNATLFVLSNGVAIPIELGFKDDGTVIWRKVK